MKALLYKEFKLAMHPMCYVFIAAFPLMILIPSTTYPVTIGFIYVLSCYPVLFLGANKGQQSNDLLYSTLLPVRKKDIVLARVITIIIMHAAFCLLTSALCPLGMMIRNNIPPANPGEQNVDVGFSLNSYVLVLAIVLVGYALADLIFFPIYYKNGKSIVLSTLMMIIGFIVYLGIFTIALPMVLKEVGVINLDTLPIYIQFIALGIALLIYALLHVFVYKVSAKSLEKVDF